MITQKDIHRFLKDNGIKSDDKITVHASLRSVGDIENGADGLIDGIVSYLADGLLLIPTHTWDEVGRARKLNTLLLSCAQVERLVRRIMDSVVNLSCMVEFII